MSGKKMPPHRYSPGEHIGYCNGIPEARVRRDQVSGRYTAEVSCSCGAYRATNPINGFLTYASALFAAEQMETECDCHDPARRTDG